MKDKVGEVGEVGELVVVHSGARTYMGMYEGTASGLRAAVAAGCLVDLSDVVECAAIEVPVRVEEQRTIAMPEGQRGASRLMLQHVSRPCMLDHQVAPVPHWAGYVSGWYVVRELQPTAARVNHAIYRELLAFGEKSLAEMAKEIG